MKTERLRDRGFLIEEYSPAQFDLSVDTDDFGEELFGSEDAYADYSVTGQDDRFQIRAQQRPPSTLLFPYNTICLIEANSRMVPCWIVFGGGLDVGVMCRAWVGRAGPRTVAGYFVKVR